MRRRRHRGRHRKDRTLPLGTVVIVASAAAGIYLTAAPGGASAASSTVYVAPTGSDTARGTRAAPYRTLEKALADVGPGTTIEVRGGTYRPTTALRAAVDGTADNRIRLRAYRGERATVDGSRLSGDSPLLSLRADFWTVSGLEFRNAPAGAVECTSCRGDVFRDLTTHANGGTGLELRGAGTRNNLIHDVASFDNRDRTPGRRTADGIAFTSGSGSGNVVSGARLQGNGDSGIELRGWGGTVTIERSHATGNGGAQAELGRSADSYGNSWDTVNSSAAGDETGTHAVMRRTPQR
ncbi:right-handed parallel beta-helix repeat-containing protein [Streptomyces palmae]|uniref:DUF1565 domain-containing protein n=1 Tax=Streptomyces palmae TaxID=1701085 RepID=A0A4Z0GMG4_9ACTN|nr:right-handed parallel beta-helix repeat-containing protein [Streptomyces palmae]TGA98235.1 DUF1565 domain-containing protein [Streptomyces palmae]